MPSGTGDTWECNNGQCITPAFWECDGFVDCFDGSDEDEHCDLGCEFRILHIMHWELEEESGQTGNERETKGGCYSVLI